MKAIVRQVLQQHLVELDTFNTAWEGVKNEPNLPYQFVYLTVSAAQTSTISEKPLATETGFMQITLFYELNQGTYEIEQRASLIRQHFYGQSFIQDNVQVVIHSPPLIAGTFLNEDKLALPVTIYYTAYQLG